MAATKETEESKRVYIAGLSAHLQAHRGDILQEALRRCAEGYSFTECVDEVVGEYTDAYKERIG